MQQIVVKPPAAAARVPVSMSSLYSWPGSRRWTCRSIRPGTTHRSLTSMIRAADQAAPDLDDPAVLRSGRRPPDPRDAGAAGSNTRPPRKHQIPADPSRPGLTMLGLCMRDMPTAGIVDHRRRDPEREIRRGERGVPDRGVAQPRRRPPPHHGRSPTCCDDIAAGRDRLPRRASTTCSPPAASARPTTTSRSRRSPTASASAVDAPSGARGQGPRATGRTSSPTRTSASPTSRPAAELVYGSDQIWPVVCFTNVYILPGVPALFRRKFVDIRDRLRATPVWAARLYVNRRGRRPRARARPRRRRAPAR